VDVWEVLQKDREGEWIVAGGVKAGDVGMALLLARETHFRHKEAESYAVRRLGDEAIHEQQDTTGIGGVIDRMYRRSEGYAGVGAKHKAVHKIMKEKGRVIDRPRPPQHRSRDEEGAHA